MGKLTKYYKKSYGKGKKPSWAAGKSRWVDPERGITGIRPTYYLQKTRAMHRRSSRFREELKFLDTAWNNVVISTSTDGADGEMLNSTGPTGACMSIPAIGDTESSRDGRKYTIKKVSLSGTVIGTARVDQAQGDEYEGFFFALVLDTQVNKIDIVSENVYQNNGTSSSQMLPYPLRNLQQSKRFRILDSVYLAPGSAYSSTDGTNTVSTSQQIAPVFTLNWSGSIDVECVGTASNVTSVSDNGIFLLAFAGSSTSTPLLRAKARVRFVG